MKRSPNLLFIFTDEQAAATMAAYGNHLIETPNLNRLASESAVFANAYVTQPVCTPSRASIMTGLYPHTTGCTENNAPLPEDVPCLPELADFSGYRTAYFGKWHLGDEVFAQHGFEEWRSIEDMYRAYYSPGRDRSCLSTYGRYLLECGFEPESVHEDGFRSFGRGRCARLPEEHGKPAYLAREACRFIEDNRARPFLLYVNFLEPHMPFFGPRDDQHDPARVPIPPNFRHEPRPGQPLKTRLYARTYRESGHSGLPLRTEADWRRMIANYWGLVSLVDTYLGLILRKLDDCGLRDDTIVVFTSDHGDMMGSHGLLAKCVMFEEAVKVPLLVRIPGLELAGRRFEEPVSQIDLVPTLLDATGRGVPEGLHGSSLLPFLSGRGDLDDRDVFIEWSAANSGFGDILGGTPILDSWREMASEEEILASISDPVRTVVTQDGWKLNASSIGEDELYDLKGDPAETRNRAGEAEHASLVRTLRERIVRWQERTGDPVGLP